MANLVRDLPAGTELGLTRRKGDCADIERLIPVALILEHLRGTSGMVARASPPDAGFEWHLPKSRQQEPGTPVISGRNLT